MVENHLMLVEVMVTEMEPTKVITQGKDAYGGVARGGGGHGGAALLKYIVRVSLSLSVQLRGDSPSRPMVDDIKFTWVIKKFSSLVSNKSYSDKVVIGGCKWSLMAYPGGNSKASTLCLSIWVNDGPNVCSGWSEHAKLSCTIVNKNPEKVSQLEETYRAEHTKWGFTSIIPLSELEDKNGGFIVNGEVKIVVEIEIFVLVKQPLKKTKLNDKGELVDVNGFQVLPSQVKFARRIFEKHSDVALVLRAKNKHLRTACMNVLLCLIETSCLAPGELSSEDLVEADNALAYVKNAGFKVDWLEKKLTKVKENKGKVHIGEIRMRELEEEQKNLKQKSLEVEALLEKEKADVLAAKTHLTLDEFV
ncbi:hypothetical protein F2Q69_00056866 [Brassica cretica]|uniref:MATH domain-containing protein n=1 Tax=Brassica cretica TaxID=69181 RepID=A0A8S9N8G7_BRACR|nr:hypothetical protein F2Q69_00056866 [Brassica cretica]